MDEQAILETVYSALREVIDPEIGINIVDLGLVYSVDVNPEKCAIRMTMTSPACPMGEMIVDEVVAGVGKVLPGRRVVVDLVWEPAWSPQCMSATAKESLGWE